MSMQYPLIGSTDWGDTINSNFLDLDTRETDNSNKIGDLSTLTTTDKTSVVNSIKELVTQSSEITQQILQRPIMTNTNINYYVNTSTGSDSNDGFTSGTAFKTIQHAIDLLPQVINHTIVLNVANGTYSEDVIINGLIGKGSLAINAASETTTFINSFGALNCGINITIFKCQATSTTTRGFYIYNCRSAKINQCYCITDGKASSKAGIEILYSNAHITNCTISNRYIGIYTTYCTTVYSTTNSGTGNTTGLYADTTSTIGKYSTQPTGTTAETTQSGGVIR